MLPFPVNGHFSQLINSSSNSLLVQKRVQHTFTHVKSVIQLHLGHCQSKLSAELSAAKLSGMFAHLKWHQESQMSHWIHLPLLWVSHTTQLHSSELVQLGFSVLTAWWCDHCISITICVWALVLRGAPTLRSASNSTLSSRASATSLRASTAASTLTATSISTMRSDTLLLPFCFKFPLYPTASSFFSEFFSCSHSLFLLSRSSLCIAFSSAFSFSSFPAGTE